MTGDRERRTTMVRHFTGPMKGRELWGQTGILR